MAKYIGVSTLKALIDALKLALDAKADATTVNSLSMQTMSLEHDTAGLASGADYAEMFEWADGNPTYEDRIGRFVTLDGDKIKLTSSKSDFVIGITSGNPTVVGDSCEKEWHGKYRKDIYNRYYSEAENKVINFDEKVISEEYNPSRTYIPRSKRPEWSAVGMVGKLVLIDDGTCEVNHYCEPSEHGIGTLAKRRTRFRVMKRLDECHVYVVIV